MLTLSPGWYWLMALVRSLPRADRRAPQRGDGVATGQPGFLGGAVRDGAGDRGSGNARAGVARVAGAAGVASEEASEAAATLTGAVTRAAALGIDLDAEEGRPSDVDRRRTRTLFDRLGDGERGVDRDGEALAAR